MGAEDNIQAVKQLYADLMRGDLDGILGALAEDVDWGFETVVTEVPWFRM